MGQSVAPAIGGPECARVFCSCECSTTLFAAAVRPLVDLGSHNKKCEFARGYECECAGCGGSRHGWMGWLATDNAIAKSPEAVEERWLEAEHEWHEYHRRRHARPTLSLKGIAANLVKLCIGRWLARSTDRTADARLAASAGAPAAGSSPHHPRDHRGSDDIPAHPIGDRPATPTPGPTAASAGTDQGDSSYPSVGPAGHTAPVRVDRRRPDNFRVPRPRAGEDQDSESATGMDAATFNSVATLAEQMTTIPFDEVMAAAGTEFDRDTLEEVSRHLAASHFWCSMFVGFAEGIEQFQVELDRIPTYVKRQIAERLQSDNPLLAYAVKTIADRLIDHAWLALRSAAFVAYPILGFLDAPSTLRTLRMLACLICPDPRKHVEVQQHAIKPLGDDATEVLTTRVKQQVAEAFPISFRE